MSLTASCTLKAIAYKSGDPGTAIGHLRARRSATEDIGTVGVAGRASYSSPTYTVARAGVTGTADAFRFVYHQISGNYLHRPA